MMKEEIETLLDEFLLKSKTPEEGDNFEDVMDLEETICSKYGIKQLPEVNEMFSRLQESGDKKVFMLNMETYAESYLSTTPDTPFTLLERAVANQLDYQEVLPELEISNHIYPVFVYNEILLKEKDSIQHVLDEFELIREDEEQEILNNIGIITFSKIPPTEHPLYDEMKKLGMRYFTDFFGKPIPYT